MQQALATHIPLAWLALAVVLGVAELLVPGVFLVFLAIAAAIVAVATLVLPDLPLAAQIGAFGMWSVVAVMIGRRWYRDYPVAGDQQLNDRQARMIGQMGEMETAIVGGEGRVRIGDGAWPARGPALAAGTRVRVVAVEGGIVLVEHRDNAAASA
jgi:membrane protein implicated in regulation of membrane protease activity